MAVAAIRVLCVDDHPMVLEGLASVIGRQSDMKLVGAATSGEQGVELFRQHRPDVTLMDIRLPAMTGWDAIRTIRSEYPDARIVVLTMFCGDHDVYRALTAGATTYVMKDSDPNELLRIIREVYDGHATVPPKVATLLSTYLAYSVLTTRELDVLQLMRKGLRNKEIANTLRISEFTVRVHVKHILSKLKVNDRTAAVDIALLRGILHLD